MAAFLCCKEIDKKLGLDLFVDCHTLLLASWRCDKKIKKQYPHIELYLLAPYALNQKREIPNGFNSTFYPKGLETVPKPFAIVQANRYMIQNSDYLISYCNNIGNTRNFVEYAQEREKKGLIKVTLL